MSMDLSVIIAAHDATDTLVDQLDALVDQDAGDLAWEVVVVDNRSTDDPRATVGRYAAAPVPVRLVEAHDVAGPGHARNVGAGSAGGGQLAFCDADDVVDAGWVVAMHEAIAAHGFVAGALDYERLNPVWARSSRGRVARTHAPRFHGIFPVASSCNLGVDAGLFASVGGFDERFVTAEDTELSLRLWCRGRPAVFAPLAIVHYRLRSDLRTMFRQSRGYARRAVILRERLVETGDLAPSRTRAVKAWAWVLAALPTLWSRRGRAHWVWVMGQRVGALEGRSTSGRRRW